MRMIAPRTGAPEVTFAEEQEEYMPITVGVYDYQSGERMLLSRWTFSDAERAKIAAGEDVYVGQLYFGRAPMTPLIVRCGPGDFALSVPEGDAP